MLVVESTFLKKKKSAVNIYIFFFSWKTHPKWTLYFSCFPPNMAALSDSEGNGGTEGWENKDGQSVVSHRGVRQTFTWGGGWVRVWWRSSWRCTVWRWTGLKAPALCEAFRWGHTDWPRHLTNTSGRQKEEKKKKKFTFKIQLVLNYSTTWKQSYSQGE